MPAQDILSLGYNIAEFNAQTKEVLDRLNAIKLAAKDVDGTIINLSNFSGGVKDFKQAADQLAQTQTNLSNSADQYNKVLLQQAKIQKANADAQKSQIAADNEVIKQIGIEADAEKKLAAAKEQTAKAAKQKADANAANVPVPFTTNLNADGSLNEPQQGVTSGTVVTDAELANTKEQLDATAALNADKKETAAIDTATASASAIYSTALQQEVAALIEDETALAANKVAQKSLQEAMVANGGATALQTEQLVALKTEQFALSESISTTRSNVKNLTKEFLSEEGSINELRAQVNRLTTQYEALSVVEKQSQFGVNLKNQINTLQPALQTAEGELGKFQRNVGNYTSATTNLFSKAFSGLRQIAYIIPGLGIAGIFNLAFQGLQKLIDLIANGSSSINTFAENLKNVNDVMAQADKSAGKQISTLKILYSAATDAANSDGERKKAALALQETYPQTFKNFTQEEIELGKAKTGYDDLTQSIIDNAKAKAAKEKIDELEAQRLDILFQKQKIINQTNKEAAEAAKAGTNTISIAGGIAGGTGTELQVSAEENRKNLLQEISARKTKAIRDQDKLDASLAEQEKFLIAFAGEKKITEVTEQEVEKRGKKQKEDHSFEDAIKAQFEALAKYSDELQQGDLDKLQQIANDENAMLGLRIFAYKKYEQEKSALIQEDADNEIAKIKANSGKSAAAQEAARAQELVVQQKASNDILKLHDDTNQKIAAAELKQKKDTDKAKLDAEEKFENSMIELGDQTLDRVKKNQAEDIANAKLIAEKKLEIEKNYQEKLKELKSREYDLGIGLVDLTQTIVDARYEREKNDIQSVIDANNQRYSQEIQNIQNSTLSQQDQAAKVAVITAEQQAQNEQLQKKQKDISVKEAKFNKAVQVASVIGDTAKSIGQIEAEAAIAQAQALTLLTNPITAALFPAAEAVVGLIHAQVPVAIALGAINIGKILATPIPTYFKGTKSAAEGYALTDEKGPELYIKPSGEIELGNDSPTLRFLQAGTQVIPHDEVNEILHFAMLKKAGQAIQHVKEKSSSDNIDKALDRHADKVVRAIMQNKPILKQKDLRAIGNEIALKNQMNEWKNFGKRN